MKSGYAVYLFDRNTMKYEEAKVMSIGMPRADLTVGNYGKMLVDITIQTADGKQNTYSVADTERTAYAGTLMLTTDKECVVGEAKGIKAQAEEALAKVAEMQEQLAMQYPMKKSDYSFLQYDSFLSATNIMKIPRCKIVDSINNGVTKFVGAMKQEHMEDLLEKARVSVLFSPKQVKDFMYP